MKKRHSFFFFFPPGNLQSRRGAMTYKKVVGVKDETGVEWSG